MSGILLHVCCAPCLTISLKAYAERGYEVKGYFYNPNIHPLKERQRRLESARLYSEQVGMDLLVDEDYPLESNLEMLLASQNRCQACFEDRLGATAERASQLGIDSFATTLSISPYQDHLLLRRAGEGAAREHGVRFEYLDLSPRYRESVDLSRAEGLYRQPYCGCVFSERDRYSGERSPRPEKRRSGS